MQPELETKENEIKDSLTFEEKIAIFDEKLETIGLDPYNKMGKMPLLTMEEEARINIKIQEGDKKYKDYLIIANIGLVTKIASRIDYFKSRFHNFEKEDLIQEGVDGLIRAVEKFDHEKGYKFSTYATYWIGQRIERAIETKAKNIRNPAHFTTKFITFMKTHEKLSNEFKREPTIEEIAERMKVNFEMAELLKTERERSFISLDQPSFKSEDSVLLVDQIEDLNAKDPEEEAIKQVLKTEMLEALKILTQKEQEVIKQRFGLNGESPQTLKEVGEIYGITRERVRQIESNALKKLRRDFTFKNFNSYNKC